MGWFKKDNKGETKNASTNQKIPELPELPRLPTLPEMEEKEFPRLRPINQLPSYPTNTLGEKFSQNTIKEAVAGKKEVERGAYAEEFDEDTPMMQMRPLRTMTRELEEDEEMEMPVKVHAQIPKSFEKAAEIARKAEPIFIRLDKFEDSLKVFEKAKHQIAEVEKMLKNIRKIKEEEEAELEMWEKEMQLIKNQIEKVDKDIFSKVA